MCRCTLCGNFAVPDKDVRITDTASILYPGKLRAAVLPSHLAAPKSEFYFQHVDADGRKTNIRAQSCFFFLFI